MTRTTSQSSTKNRTLVAAAALLAMLPISAPPALAQSAQQAEEMLKQADANRDGQITWTEVEQLRARSFARLDRNGDGYIDAADRPSMFGGRFDTAMKSVARFDANNDGRISSSEMMTAEAPVFTQADTNNDQILTSAEIEAMRASR